MHNLWIASFNQGKLKEFQSLFKNTDFTIKSAKEFDFYKAPEETGTTFLENAMIKAKAFKPKSDIMDGAIHGTLQFIITTACRAWVHRADLVA